MSFDDYNLIATRTLMSFQYIEELLRMYLSRAYDLIKFRLAGDLPFKQNDLIERKALGALLKEFSRLNDNKELISKISALIPQRNRVAHEAYLLTVEEMNDAPKMLALAGDFDKINATASQCVRQLAIECEKLDALIANHKH
jgi:hypothetical protein